jgi:hypothetical protein
MHRRAAIDFLKRWLRRSAWAALTVWVVVVALSCVAPLSIGGTVSFSWVKLSTAGIVAERGTIRGSWAWAFGDSASFFNTFMGRLGVISEKRRPVVPAAFVDDEDRELIRGSQRVKNTPTLWLGDFRGAQELPDVTKPDLLGRSTPTVEIEGYSAIGAAVGVVPNAIASLVWIGMMSRWLLRCRPILTLARAGWLVRSGACVTITLYVAGFAISWWRPLVAGVYYEGVTYSTYGTGLSADRGVMTIRYMKLHPTPDTSWPGAVLGVWVNPLVDSDRFRSTTPVSSDKLRRINWGGGGVIRSQLIAMCMSGPQFTEAHLVIGRYPSMAIVALWLVLVVRWSIKRMRRPAGRGFEVAMASPPELTATAAKNS